MSAPGMNAATNASPLDGVHVVVCVTGSVAAIKAGELLRQLQDAGADCRLAASEKGAVFLGHSQQPLPSGVPMLQATPEQAEVWPLRPDNASCQCESAPVAERRLALCLLYPC